MYDSFQWYDKKQKKLNWMTCPNIPMYCPLSVHSLAVQSSEAESNKAPLSRDMYSTLDTEPLCACQLASSGGLPSGLSSVEPALWVVDQTWRTNLWKGHITIVFPPLRCSSSCWWIKSNSKRLWNRLIKPKISQMVWKTCYFANFH